MENAPITYRLVITKRTPNPNWAKEQEELEKRGRFNDNMNYRGDQRPEPTITTDVLICELSEAQFKTVKAEALKVFE